MLHTPDPTFLIQLRLNLLCLKSVKQRNMWNSSQPCPRYTIRVTCISPTHVTVTPSHITSSQLMTHSQLNCTVPDIWVGHLDVAAPERGIWNKCFYPFIYFDKKFICLISFPRADNYVNFCDICFAVTEPANTYPICSGRSATVCRSRLGTSPLLCDCPCPPACGRYPRTPPAGQSRNWTLPSGCCWTVATTETRLSHFQRGHETENTK